MFLLCLVYCNFHHHKDIMQLYFSFLYIFYVSCFWKYSTLQKRHIHSRSNFQSFSYYFNFFLPVKLFPYRYSMGVSNKLQLPYHNIIREFIFDFSKHWFCYGNIELMVHLIVWCIEWINTLFHEFIDIMYLPSEWVSMHPFIVKQL